ncbi:hypothetical protein OH77DRAFT_1444820 [Trametes cingulata]|nr:hypothetical protein OH77DRAFT_1444820 [Trametes cingulata]
MDVPLTASEKVPAEIWLEILDLVPSTADLHSLSVSCKMFHDLTMRALHRDLMWTKPAHVARSLPLWEQHPGMDAAVRSLELGVSAVPPGIWLRTIGLDGEREDQPVQGPYMPTVRTSVHDNTHPRRLRRDSTHWYPSRALHDAMLARIHTFTNIASLTFTGMVVNDVHFALVHSLSRLRSLRFDFCVFQGAHAPHAQAFNHATLPITELTMLNVRRNTSDAERLTHVLSLCTAHNLRTLTVDPTADVFQHIYGAWNAPTHGWTVPPSLEHVFVVRQDSNQEVQPAPFGGNNFPETHMYHFAVHAHGLRTLSTPMFVPQNVTIAPEALPASLTRFAAPVETATVVAAARDVESLGVLNCGLESREAINALESVAASRPKLKMLMIELKGWDDEIVPAVADLFKELRRLKIVYKGDTRPSEELMVMLAPEFLAKLPELHTLELYADPGPGGRKSEYPRALYDDSFESIEEELVNLVIPWNRYCPKLRRVQVCVGYVVQRTWEGGPWSVERQRRLQEKDDLSF